MKALILTILLTFVANISHAQRALKETAPDTVSVYGFAESSYEYSDSLKTNPVDYFTIGLSAGWDGYSFIGEYDPFNNRVSRIQARLSFSALGGKVTLIPGRSLSPVAYQYSSPKSLRLPTWGKSLGGFTIYGNGLASWYKRGNTTMRLAYFSEPDRLSTAIKYHWLSAYYESDVGIGGVITPPVKSRWINPKIGVTYYQDKVLKSGNTAIFLQNYFQVSESTRLYGQVDFGDVEERIMAGASIELRPYWYLNLYWQNQVDRDEFYLSLKYSFN